MDHLTRLLPNDCRPVTVINDTLDEAGSEPISHSAVLSMFVPLGRPGSEPEGRVGS